MIESAWNTAVHILATMPAWLAAVLIGWAVSAGVTQTLKFFMPLAVPADHRENMTRIVAVVTAAVVAAVTMVDRGGSATAATLVAIATGVWSPVAFAMLQAVLRRWWPWAADVLSADVRGVLRSGQ